VLGNHKKRILLLETSIALLLSLAVECGYGPMCLHFIEGFLHRNALWHNNQFSIIVLDDPNTISI